MPASPITPPERAEDQTVDRVQDDPTPEIPIEEAEDLLSTAAAGPAAVRGGAIRTVGYVATSLVALGSGALLYRHIGVVRSGHYTTALSLVALVATISDLGLTSVGIRELSLRTGDERRHMTSTLTGLRLVITGLGMAGVTVFALLAYGGTLALGTLLAGIGLLFAIWQGTLAIPLIVELRLGWATLFEFLRQLIQSLLIVALVLAGAGLLPFLAASIPAGVAVLVLTVWVFRGRVPTQIRFAPGEWRALITPILSYAIAVAAAALYFRMAILILSLVSSGRQLGYFSVSFNIMAALFVVPGMLITAAFPIFSRAARDDHARLAYVLERVFEVSLIAGAWATLAIALGSSLAVEVLGGPKFAPASTILAIQGIAVGATFVGTVWSFALLSLNRHRAILLFNLWALLAVIVVVAVLADLDGARGAAIGAASVEVANLFIGYLILVRGRRHLRPSMRVVPKVAIAIAIAAIPALLPVGEITRIVLSCGLYLLVLLGLRALPAELVDLIPFQRSRRADGR
jgi:O-antigen/teichoic acid export membrane protein